MGTLIADSVRSGNNTNPKMLVEGDRCYQTEKGTPQISDGMPVHVKLRQRSD